jgi:hypothetical protein
MAAQQRMTLGSLIESFERFLKDLAIVCVDHIAPYVFDDRFEDFSPTGTELAAHFNARSIGKAMCESGTWLNNRLVNDRFRRLLSPRSESRGNFSFPMKSNRRWPSAIGRARWRCFGKSVIQLLTIPES